MNDLCTLVTFPYSLSNLVLPFKTFYKEYIQVRSCKYRLYRRTQNIISNDICIHNDIFIHNDICIYNDICIHNDICIFITDIAHTFE